MTTPNPEREAFEKFFRSRNSKGVDWRERMFDRRAEDDTYVEKSVQCHWWTWQNALLARAQASAEDARDAAQWQDHQNLIRASTMKNTLHISLRVNVDGMYNTRDGILDIQSVRQSAIQAPEIVAMTCKRYFTEMLDAIAAMRERTPPARA